MIGQLKLEACGGGGVGGCDRKGCGRRRSVVWKVRFPLMGEEYLRNRIVGVAGVEHGEWMASLVVEALPAKTAQRQGAVFEFEQRRWGGRR